MDEALAQINATGQELLKHAITSGKLGAGLPIWEVIWGLYMFYQLLQTAPPGAEAKSPKVAELVMGNGSKWGLYFLAIRES